MNYWDLAKDPFSLYFSIGEKRLYMKYRFEYNGNPEYVTLHLTHKLIESTYVSNSCEGTIEEENLRIILNGVDGVVEASLHPYEITIKYGMAFEREDILRGTLEITKMYLYSQGISDQEWEQLPTLRSDILSHICKQCEAEQNEMWDSIRD
jgi:hypothetical protein